MKLFDEFDTRDDEYMPYGESRFGYLNRSGRPEFEKMRNLLEEWFLHYPEEEQKGLHRRFHSSKGDGYLSPFFELFLHELLLKMECSVTIQPKANDETENRPDFLVQTPDGDSLYLEAVAISGESAVEKATNSRKSEIHNAINRRLNSPNYFLDINVIEEGTTAPPARSMVNFLANELKKFDPDEVADNYNNHGITSLPNLEFVHQGWRINFFPIPKKKEDRGDTDHPIGMISKGDEWVEVNQRLPLLDSLKKKASRYKKTRLPVHNRS